jgi:hypothetical protein
MSAWNADDSPKLIANLREEHRRRKSFDAILPTP